MLASSHFHLIVGHPLVTFHGLSGVVLSHKLYDGMASSHFDQLLIQTLDNVHLRVDTGEHGEVPGDLRVVGQSGHLLLAGQCLP